MSRYAETLLSRQPTLELYDLRNGDLALSIKPFDTPQHFCAPQRTNYFTVFWIQEGHGSFYAESGHYPFAAASLLFLAPYQSFRFICDSTSLRGLCLKFHANFLCIETYHEEAATECFSTIHSAPVHSR